MTQIRTGRKGRPADVRKRVEAVLAGTLFDLLRKSHLIPAAISTHRLRAEAISLAGACWEDLNAAGFRLLHARLASELAVLTGELPAADNPALPKPHHPDSP